MKFIVLQNKNIINHGKLKKTLVGTPERRLQWGEGSFSTGSRCCLMTFLALGRMEASCLLR